MEYKLLYPIKTDEGEERKTLNMRERIKGADLLALDEADGEMGKNLKLIARMCKISQYEAEQLDMEDINILSETLSKK